MAVPGFWNLLFQRQRDYSSETAVYVSHHLAQLELSPNLNTKGW